MVVVGVRQLRVDRSARAMQPVLLNLSFLACGVPSAHALLLLIGLQRDPQLYHVGREVLEAIKAS